MIFSIQLFALLSTVSALLNGQWSINRPLISIDSTLEPRLPRFVTNWTNGDGGEQWREMEVNGDHLLIGPARVSLPLLTSHQHLQTACHNFIRIVSSDVDNQSLYVCGTNAYRPLCKLYKDNTFGDYVERMEFSGLGLAPFDPQHNSSFVRDGQLLYSATVVDFAAADPLVHRRNLSSPEQLGIRTERNDAKVLYQPQFIGAVHFWFREESTSETIDQCPIFFNRRFSTVARVCKGDFGGPRQPAPIWTSFLKVRLNCSIPGDLPFSFDQIEAISSPVRGKYSSTGFDLIYAVFLSPLSGISMSAVCAFDLALLEGLMARASPCVNDSRLLSEERLSHSRNNPLLLGTTVPNFFGVPLAVHDGPDKYTKIVVDAQVSAFDARTYDILYIGTDSGAIHKVVNVAGAGAKYLQSTVHVATVKAISGPVRNLKLYHKDSSTEPFLLVLGDDELVKLPLEWCSKAKSCLGCVSLRDPHCAWHLEKAMCIATITARGQLNDRFLLQDVSLGRTSKCPSGEERLDDSPLIPESRPDERREEESNCDCDVSRQPDSTNNVSTTTAAIGVAGALVLGVLLGLVIACLIYSTCSPSSKDPKASSMERERRRPPPLPLPQTPLKSSSSIIDAYRSSSSPKCFPEPPDSPVSLDEQPFSQWATSTLPRNYRVKQMYL